MICILILIGFVVLFIDFFIVFIVGVIIVFRILIVGIDVNLWLWRKNVVFEIYEKVFKNKDEVVKEVILNVMEWCKIIKFYLDFIVL